MTQNEPEKEPLGPEAVADAQAAAARWTDWARHDFRHFLDPVAEATGLTRTEVLLYILGERLGEIAEHGILLHVVVHQPDRPDDPSEEGEAWKRGRK